MSAEEDTELRDLVAQTLETNGVLGKIRAQLRANIFLALEEQENIQNKTPYQNKQLKSFIETKDGRLVTSLVREFLEFFNLDFTIAVFDPESGAGDSYDGRANLARDLNIVESEKSKKEPLLADLIKRSSGDNVSRSDINRAADKNHELHNADQNVLKQPSASGKTVPPNINHDNKGSIGSNEHTEHIEDDPFFDDPFPKNPVRNGNFTSTSSKVKETKSNAKPSNIPKPQNSTSSGSAMSSLAGLPALGENTVSNRSPRSPEMESDIKDIDKKIADLGFELPEDDYEDDFLTSESMSPRGHTPRSDMTGQTPRSEVGLTPRTDRSDKARTKSLEEDIEEDLDEDFSVADDLLKSSQSTQDDLTTDRTISPTDQNGGFDYMEDIVKP